MSQKVLGTYQRLCVPNLKKENTRDFIFGCALGHFWVHTVRATVVRFEFHLECNMRGLVTPSVIPL